MQHDEPFTSLLLCIRRVLGQGSNVTWKSTGFFVLVQYHVLIIRMNFCDVYLYLLRKW